MAITKETLGSETGIIYNSPSLWIALQLRAPNSKKGAETSPGLLTAVFTCNFDNDIWSFGNFGKMCIKLKRFYLNCGHEKEKIVRCALPYYWKRNRADPIQVPEPPAQYFDRVEQVNPQDPGPIPYFGCFDCLDEIEEQYYLGCPDCSGQGSVHSEKDLSSRTAVKSGRDNLQAYELMKQNYHRYLIDFLSHWPQHSEFLLRVNMEYRYDAMLVNAPEDDEPPDSVIYRAAMARIGPQLWSGPDVMLESLMDKMLAEVKCRLETTHYPPDAGLDWETKETHLAEHIPALNNISTALRRTMALDIERSLRRWLGMYLAPERAPDFDGARSRMFTWQTFAVEALMYQQYMWAFRSENIAAPPNIPGKGVPYDILEFVPQWPREIVDARMNQLSRDLRDEQTRAEIEAPRGDETIRGGRDPQTYQRHEDFTTHTVGFIFQLLALDPGLSGDRMVEIARLFHSVLMEPWYEIYGHPARPSIPERGVGYIPEGHEASNADLRSIIQDLVDVHTSEGFNLPPNLNWWWERLSYTAVQAPGSNLQAANLTLGQVHLNATSIWQTFYKSWLQVLANVELSHTKLSQQQLDNQTDKECPICQDAYNVNHQFNCPVYYGCPNNHVLDKKCYTTLSLTPTRPYNRLQADRYCPTCRAVIQYNPALNTNILQDMQFMPTFNVQIDPNSFRR